MWNRIVRELYRQCLLAPGFLLPWIMLTPSVWKFSPWPYAQPTFVLLIFLCFLSAVGLSLHFFSFLNESNIENKFTIDFDYASIVCFGMAIWSIIVSYFSCIPWLSWVGAPQLGMGIIWYIAFGVMIIAYRLLLNSKYLFAFVINLVIAVITIACLSYFGDARHGLIPNFKFSPYFINEHIIFIGIPLMGLGFLLDNKIYKKTLIILGGIIILASTNRTGYLGVGVGAFLCGIAYYINKKKVFPNYSHYFFAVLIFLIPFAIYLISLVLQYITSEGSFLASSFVRYHYWQACVNALVSDPFRWLVGFGWGSYSDIILANIQSMPPNSIFPSIGSMELFLLPAISQTWQQLGLDINNLLLVGGVGFHSHNQFIETLFSVGIIGELLFSMLLVLPVLLCDKSKLTVVIFCSAALNFTLCGWYELPGTLPYVAIFFAAAVPNSSLRRINFKRVFQFTMPWIMAILLVFGLAILYFNLRFDKVRAKFSSNQPDVIVVNDYIESSGPGGNYLAVLLRDFYRGVVDRPLTPVDIKVLQDILHASQKVRNPSLVMVSSAVPLYNFLMINTQDPRLDGFKNMLLHSRTWECVLETVIARWYVRVDLLLPYFDWHLQHGRKNFVRDVIKNILKKYGDNPVLQNYLKKIDV